MNRATPRACCLWCGAALLHLPTERRPYAAVRCASCGTGTTIPQPTADELNSAYGDWYRPPQGRFRIGGDKLLRYLRGRTAHWVSSLSPPGPILDVGCGDGTMLDAFHRQGRRALGLERVSRREDVLAGSLADCEGGWGAIVMWHSLEHLAAPRQALAEAAARLVEGGIIVIAVPNWDSVQARVFGSRWLHLDLPRHLSHLTAGSLTAALLAEGLEPIEVSYRRGGQVVFGWLHGFVGWLPGHPDLYQAIRRPSARAVDGPVPRWLVLVSAVFLGPLAVVAAGLEVMGRRGGTVCVVGRKKC